MPTFQPGQPTVSVQVPVPTNFSQPQQQAQPQQQPVTKPAQQPQGEQKPHSIVLPWFSE